jgi:membrane-associated phospholipid phosphatase
MMRVGIISDLSLPKRSDRFAPYAVSILSFLFLIYYFYKLGLPTWFLMMIGASIIVMLLATIITLWWKISAHMFGVAGLIGGVMSVCYFIEKTNPTYLFMTLFIIAGMVGTSRIILKRHTPAQVYAGFVLGFTVSFIGVWLGS